MKAQLLVGEMFCTLAAVAFCFAFISGFYLLYLHGIQPMDAMKPQQASLSNSIIRAFGITGA
jgi:hypothetical protein